MEGSTTWSQLARADERFGQHTLKTKPATNGSDAAELDFLAGLWRHAWRMSLPREQRGRPRWIAPRCGSAGRLPPTLGGIVTTGWTTLADGPLAVGDMAWSWDMDFGQPLTREADMNLMVDLALDGVTWQRAVARCADVPRSRHFVPNAIPRRQVHRNSCAWTATTAWKSTPWPCSASTRPSPWNVGCVGCCSASDKHHVVRRVNAANRRSQRPPALEQQPGLLGLWVRRGIRSH